MSDAAKPKYEDNLKDSIRWWLVKRKPFIINDEYKLELLYIDRDHMSAKIRITNLKTNQSTEVEGGE